MASSQGIRSGDLPFGHGEEKSFKARLYAVLISCLYLDKGHCPNCCAYLSNIRKVDVFGNRYRIEAGGFDVDTGLAKCVKEIGEGKALGARSPVIDEL